MPFYRPGRLRFFVALMILVLVWQSGYSKSIVIIGREVIDRNIQYKDVELDISRGYFQIVNQATLKIQDCVIKGIITPHKPNLIDLVSGHLILKNNRFTISSSGLPETPVNATLYNVIEVLQGDVMILGNKFVTDKPYTIGLLVTGKFVLSNFYLINNIVKNFHDAMSLLVSHFSPGDAFSICRWEAT